jgi:hypothetical protein
MARHINIIKILKIDGSTETVWNEAVYNLQNFEVGDLLYTDDGGYKFIGYSVKFFNQDKNHLTVCNEVLVKE